MKPMFRVVLDTWTGRIAVRRQIGLRELGRDLPVLVEEGLEELPGEAGVGRGEDEVVGGLEDGGVEVPRPVLPEHAHHADGVVAWAPLRLCLGAGAEGRSGLGKRRWGEPAREALAATRMSRLSWSWRKRTESESWARSPSAKSRKITATSRPENYGFRRL